MPNLVEYRFEINGVTPETLPMQRLAVYLQYLSDLLGSPSHLHLTRVETSSAVQIVGIEGHESIRAERRVLAVRHGGGPIAARRAYAEMDAALAEDDANATLSGPPGKLIEFPGNKRPLPEPSLGPIQDEAIVDGEVVQISGRDESISVYLRKDKQEQICTGTRSQGRDLARYLFACVRVFGVGNWLRTPQGKWDLQDVRIRGFVPLRSETFSQTVDRLHSVESEAVSVAGDAARFLEDLRHGRR